MESMELDDAMNVAKGIQELDDAMNAAQAIMGDPDREAIMDPENWTTALGATLMV